ncbi:MAG: hypothetical protein QNJ46_25240 [Leptolyngbyaceae cyanobacterium MO_188.B28]|nr:hypothetical protein [Leptolyngbyaceae cyanobacterium MO_188.B28]
MTSSGSQSPETEYSPSQQPPQPQSVSGRLAKKLLVNIWEPSDLLGKGLLGDLWRTTYLSIQDAIALSILLRIPGLIGRLIIGKEFNGFDVCLQENALGASRYACFIIVTSDFGLWFILAVRIIGRFWADLSDIRKPPGSK